MPGWTVSAWLFLRLLGVVYLVAFWSLETQILGLAGSHGIEPAQAVIANARAWAASDHLGLARFLQWPTVFWLGVSDRWLIDVCRLGMLLSLPLICGVGSAVVLPALWLLYLSLATVTGQFLGFQWDALLLETGAIASVLAPWALVERPGRDEPTALSRCLLWWLLFRLMFASGVVKLASGDPLWRGLSALTVHFETQPLPTPLGWYAHQLPAWFQQIATALVLIVELLVPWFIVVSVDWRRRAGIVFVVLQACIAATGNYAFFNLLSAALALTLVDDDAWGRAVSPRWLGVTAATCRPPRRGQWVPAALLATVMLPISLDILARQTGVSPPGSTWTLALREVVLPLRTINVYGLFAVMTPTRPEVTIEGSSDGQTWRAYAFRYKPGDPLRRPRWVAPFHPRLDWQMWFAALGEADESPWFQPLCRRLLEGAPAVLSLLAENPFPDRPPRFVRAVRAGYRMTTLTQRRGRGQWWSRGTESLFQPPLALNGAPPPD